MAYKYNIYKIRLNQHYYLAYNQITKLSISVQIIDKKNFKIK